MRRAVSVPHFRSLPPQRTIGCTILVPCARSCGISALLAPRLRAIAQRRYGWPPTPRFLIQNIPASVSVQYAARVAAGKIERDAAQLAIVDQLAQLEKRLAEHRLARKSSSLGWLFARARAPESMKGLYIYGEVGRGKTMLMDLFFDASPVVRKRRVHFHDFMADVHQPL